MQMMSQVLHEYLPHEIPEPVRTANQNKRGQAEEVTASEKRRKPVAMKEEPAEDPFTIDLNEEERELVMKYRAGQDHSRVHAMENARAHAPPTHHHQQQDGFPARHCTPYGTGAQTVININHVASAFPWDEDNRY